MTAEWGPRWLCYVCRRNGTQRKAVVRVFSGVMADGFPGCEEHRKHAELEALYPMTMPLTPIGYDARAYEVIEGDDGPKMGKKLWQVEKVPATS